MNPAATANAPVTESADVSNRPELLVVIVNYKTARLTVACLETLEPELAAIPGARVAVVENASGDGEALARAIAERGWGGWVDLDVAEVNGGFAYGNNRPIRAAMASGNPPRFVLLLNSDTEVRPGAIRILLDDMRDHPDVGIAGGSFENLDGSDWPIAFRFITPLSELESGFKFGPVTRLLKRHVVARVMEQDAPQPIDWVAGASMMIRWEVFEAIGLMDEDYFLYFEEVDFCLRAKRHGWPCRYVPKSRVMHIAGQSSGLTERDRRPPRTPAYWFESRRRYFLKNFGLAGAISADLAFGFGFWTCRLRRIVQRKPDLDPPHFLADFWKQSVLRRKNRRSIPRA
ncbi:glycosyltransferase family 2 protein [Tundrisphaera sp. TA3]|uniref:glycosyltransferase family 2 protein n=1 Tax=Tundrisphaera sp. TA3 TaxID=3435775 RepID=UPI003EB78B48